MFLQLFITPAILAIGILNQLAMTIPFPMSDALLMSWDLALGFKWLAYAMAVTSHPYLILTLETSYSLLMPVIFWASAIMILFGKRKRASEFCALIMLTAALCIMLASMFPAFEVPYVLSNSAPPTKLPSNFGTHHVEQLLAMRSSSAIFLDPKNFKGLSSLPSYHTIAGLLIVYACRGYVIPFVLAATYTSLMLISTPVYGGHYLVDIIAGIVFTGIFLVFWRKYGAKYIRE